MILTTYQNAADFLLKTQAGLEKNEAANNLMLGICLQLRNFPEKIKTARYLATVTDEHGLVAAAVMTPPHKLVVYSEKSEHGEALELFARDLLADRWILPGVLGPSRVTEAFAVTWARVAGTSFRQGMRQRIYELRKVIPPPSSRGVLRLATEDDIELVAPWIFAFTEETLTGGDMAEARETAMSKISDHDLYIWEDGQPVAMVGKARSTANGIAVNLVYTPPAMRRRGYASSCVAALSQLLLDAGWKFCCLFTDLSNPTSNSIYQKIGYRPVCDYNEYVFEVKT